MKYDNARTVTLKLFEFWLMHKESELKRLESRAREWYSRIRRIASRNVKNPVDRAVLKVIDRALRFAVRMVEDKIKRLRDEIRRIEEAGARLESGDPFPAMDLLVEAGAVASFPTGSDVPAGPPSINYFFMELIEGLRGEKR